MLIRDFYQGQIISASKDTSIKEAALLMAAKGVGFIVVTTTSTNSTPIGVITDRDLVIKSLALGLSSETKIETIIGKNLFTIESYQSVGDAVDLMSKFKVRRLVVLDHAGHAWSVISSDDILGYFCNQLKKIGEIFKSQDGGSARNQTHDYTRMA